MWDKLRTPPAENLWSETFILVFFTRRPRLGLESTFHEIIDGDVVHIRRVWSLR
jgi:hypothetical protein